MTATEIVGVVILAVVLVFGLAVVGYACFKDIKCEYNLKDLQAKALKKYLGEE